MLGEELFNQWLTNQIEPVSLKSFGGHFSMYRTSSRERHVKNICTVVTFRPNSSYVFKILVFGHFDHFKWSKVVNFEKLSIIGQRGLIWRQIPTRIRFRDKKIWFLVILTTFDHYITLDMVKNGQKFPNVIKL